MFLLNKEREAHVIFLLTKLDPRVGSKACSLARELSKDRLIARTKFWVARCPLRNQADARRVDGDA